MVCSSSRDLLPYSYVIWVHAQWVLMTGQPHTLFLVRAAPVGSSVGHIVSWPLLAALLSDQWVTVVARKDEDEQEYIRASDNLEPEDEATVHGIVMKLSPVEDSKWPGNELTSFYLTHFRSLSCSGWRVHCSLPSRALLPLLSMFAVLHWATLSRYVEHAQQLNHVFLLPRMPILFNPDRWTHGQTDTWTHGQTNFHWTIKCGAWAQLRVVSHNPDLLYLCLSYAIKYHRLPYLFE